MILAVYLIVVLIAVSFPTKEYKSFYRLKKKHEPLRLYLAEQIGCDKRPESLNRIPYNSSLGFTIREAKLENNFEIFEEEITNP